MELNYTHLSCSGVPFMPDWEQACSARWCTDTFRENLGSAKSLKSDSPKINLKSWHEVTLKSRRRLQVDWRRVCLPVWHCASEPLTHCGFQLCLLYSQWLHCIVLLRCTVLYCIMLGVDFMVLFFNWPVLCADNPSKHGLWEQKCHKTFPDD